MTSMQTDSGRSEVPREETAFLIASDKVEGTAVYGPDGEKIARIENLMIDKFSALTPKRRSTGTTGPSRLSEPTTQSARGSPIEACAAGVWGLVKQSGCLALAYILAE